MADAGINFSNDQATGIVHADGFTGVLNNFNTNNPTFAPATFPSGFTRTAATIAAHVGGGRASATAITTNVVNVTPVTNVGDSVLLPTAVAGQSYVVANSGANAMQVFSSGTDTINGVAGATGVSQGPGLTVEYEAIAAGTWQTIGTLTTTATGQTAYNVNSTAPTANNVQLTAANITGGVDFVALAYTAAAGAGFTLTTPTGAQIIALVPSVATNTSYLLRILNVSSTQTATLTANATGVTVTGTATIGTATWRDFEVTVTGATTVTFQNIGGGNIV